MFNCLTWTPGGNRQRTEDLLITNVRQAKAGGLRWTLSDDFSRSKPRALD